MIIVKKFNDVSELQKLQRIACSVPEDVYLHPIRNPNPGGAGLIPAPLFSFNRQFVTFL